MVIVELSSGLGNQLFQYAAARSLALQLGYNLIIDNHIFLEDHYRQPKICYFNITASFVIPNKKSAHVMFNKTLRLFFHKSKNIEEVEWWNIAPFDITDLVKSKIIKIKGGWASYNYFNQYADIIKKELYVKHRYTKNITTILSNISVSNSVAVHIRKGDYVQSAEAKKIFYELTADYYHKAIHFIDSKIKDPIFYIFSNDMDWVKDNFKRQIKQKCIYISEQYKLQDYEEFELMRNCKHQIIANSTFSWWAAFLNPNTNKIIVQPQRWYNHKPAQHNYENGQLLGKLGLLI